MSEIPMFTSRTREYFLRQLLREIVEHDTDYTIRNRLLFEAMLVAQDLGYKAGIRFDEKEPAWPVVFLAVSDPITGKELQLSWHVEQYPDAWDGHSTQEKFERIRRFLGEDA